MTDLAVHDHASDASDRERRWIGAAESRAVDRMLIELRDVQATRASSQPGPTSRSSEPFNGLSLIVLAPLRSGCTLTASPTVRYPLALG